MESSLGFRPRLYRKAALAVIFTSLTVLAFAQFAKKAPSSKGPRALGVLEVAANGKAHLIAVTIMIDGRFYDAGAYKADPIPMALQPETVYEGVKTGISQGLFSVSGAIHDDKNGWMADGKWRSTAQIESDKAKAKAEQEKLAQKAPEVEQGPPKLKRGVPTEEKTPQSQPETPAEKKPATSDKSASSTSDNKSSDINADPNRPVLRHQPVSETPHEQTKPGIPSEPLKGPIELIPAISDADGPEPRPYNYQMKPEEEQTRLKKMVAMATDEVKGRVEASQGSSTGTQPGNKPARRSAQGKSAHDLQLQNPQLRVFDLSNSNEPVLVLTASAKAPNSAGDLTYMTTLVAREDIYGDLHKVFAQTTDNQHLDVLPKYELVDAVDADGDGRGELLFRMIGDNGSAFGVYRVIGDRLWPLFEGKPGT